MNSSSSFQQQLDVHYDGSVWQAFDMQQNMLTLSVEDGNMLPSLPEYAVVSSLLLPIEHLLTRTFKLPLSSPKFIDQDILAQELEDHTSEDSQAWWLSWQAGKTNDGVAGLMLGLPESLRQYIDSHEAWQHAQTINADICLRLNAQRNKQYQEHSELQQSSDPIAIFDTDSNGLFFAVWQASADNSSDGFWLAMRRLNWFDSDIDKTSLVEDMKRSLHSMGWNNAYHSAGYLPTALHADLNFTHWSGDLANMDDLPSRHDANLAVTNGAAINGTAINSAASNMEKSNSNNFNFRHGSWRSTSRLAQLKPWYRSIALVVSLMFIWTAGMMWQNHQLQQQLSNQQQHVITAFHAGLPHETVIIDALAQLRKAAGGNKGATKKNQIQAKQWLQDIQAINQVYQQIPWILKTLSFQHGQMSMRGQTADLQNMNSIRQALQQKIGRDVKLQDTDLSNHHVTFNMVWS